MRRLMWAVSWAAVLGATGITAPEAQTQTGLTEKQARAAVVPYVRAATDCIAKKMGEDPRFATFAREARTMDLMPEAIVRCRPAVRTMIEMHDRYYGPGYGEQFAQGAYFDDLPRALGTRLKDQIAAVVARDAAEAEARAARVSTMRDQREKAYATLWDCIADKTRTLVSSGERAELVADAVLAVCSPEFGRYLDAAVVEAGLQGLTPAAMLGLREELATTIRKQVVSLAVVVKSKDTAPARPMAQTPTPSSASGMNSMRSCIEDIAKTAKTKLAEQDTKLAVILDLCRPEIEASARDAYSGSSSTLEELRQKAFVDAKAMAERALDR